MIIRDIFIIVFVGLLIILLLVAGIIGLQLYRKVNRVTSNLKEISDRALNQIVKPLSRVAPLISAFAEFISRTASKERRQEQEEPAAASSRNSRHAE